MRVLRRTTLTVYTFGLEARSNTSTGSHTYDQYYYSLPGRLWVAWVIPHTMIIL